jgi:hypothetical protein
MCVLYRVRFRWDRAQVLIPGAIESTMDQVGVGHPQVCFDQGVHDQREQATVSTGQTPSNGYPRGTSKPRWDAPESSCLPRGIGSKERAEWLADVANSWRDHDGSSEAGDPVDETPGIPTQVEDEELPARLQHPVDLLESLSRIWPMMEGKGAHHEIQVPVGEGQGLDITLAELQTRGEVAGSQATRGHDYHLGGDVQANHMQGGETPGDLLGQVARTAADVDQDSERLCERFPGFFSFALLAHYSRS